MSSPLLNVDAYWQALSASKPVVQTLEGHGTQLKLDEPEVRSFQPVSRAPRFDNNI